MRSFEDVLLFSTKLKMLKITRKENRFEIYLSHSYAPARLTPLVCVHSHPRPWASADFFPGEGKIFQGGGKNILFA